jgi:hypothetical protein
MVISARLSKLWDHGVSEARILEERGVPLSHAAGCRGMHGLRYICTCGHMHGSPMRRSGTRIPLASIYRPPPFRCISGKC